MWRERSMAAMKPRTGDGPLEATKEGRGIVMRVPLEGGGRLVVELTPEEAAAFTEPFRSSSIVDQAVDALGQSGFERGRIVRVVMHQDPGFAVGHHLRN